MNNNLNFNRLYKLILLDIIPSLKPSLLFLGTFLLILLFTHSADLHAYFIILYAGGFVATSKVFRDFHDPKKANIYLMLPCSNLERFVSKWFVTSLGLVCITLVVFYLFATLKNIFYLFSSNYPFSILDKGLWLGILHYFILQSIFLLGAIFFKKHALLKTAFCLAFIFITLSLFTAFIGWLFFYPYHMVQGFWLLELSVKGWGWIFWIGLAPICWYLTYLRITEYELK